MLLHICKPVSQFGIEFQSNQVCVVYALAIHVRCTIGFRTEFIFKDLMQKVAADPYVNSVRVRFVFRFGCLFRFILSVVHVL